MDLVRILSRKGGLSVRAQLARQLQMKILSGELAPGQRLPSVRALARRLKLHANTVSAAFTDLRREGLVEQRPGSGVYVRRTGPRGVAEADALDEMIRQALWTAFERGHSGTAIRAAVLRWLRAAPPDRVVVVDPQLDLAELVAHEAARALDVRAEAATLADVERDPGRLAGALALTLPQYAEAVRRAARGSAVEVVRLEPCEAAHEAIRALPAGSVVLAVAHSAAVLPYASVLARGLRGDELLVEPRLLAQVTAWKRLAPVADLVLADALAAPVVRRARPKRLCEVSLLLPPAVARLKDVLGVVVPAPE
jgi:GntR family transcriptional regulator